MGGWGWGGEVGLGGGRGGSCFQNDLPEEVWRGEGMWLFLIRVFIEVVFKVWGMPPTGGATAL